MASVELWEAFEGATAVVVVRAQDRQGYKYLVGVQTGIVAAQVVGLGALDGLDECLGD